MSWFADGITEAEVGAIDNLAYMAQSSGAVAEQVADLPWFSDGITEMELEGLEYLKFLASDSEATASRIVNMSWFADGITEAEVGAIDNLAYMAQSSGAVAEQVADLPWFSDGITEMELEGLEHLKFLASDSEATASRIVNMSWFADGITEAEVGAIDNLAYMAQSSGAVAEQVADLPWFSDGITEMELEGLEHLKFLASDSEATASRIVNMSWFADGITEAEVGAIDNLAYMAQSSGAVAEQVADLPWFVDGVTAIEVDAIDELAYVAQSSPSVAERIVGMPFLTAIGPVDIPAINALAALAAFSGDSLEQIMAHPSIARGITDELTPVVAMLYGVVKTNPSLIERLLNPEEVDLERRSITLPITGDVDLAIVRTRPGAARGMDLLEYSVRASEELIGKPLPTHYVGLLYEGAAGEGPAGQNFGTHIAILPEFDVDDGSFDAEFAPHIIAHEVSHYYWVGNANWIDEGLADFMASAIQGRRTGELVRVTNAPCSYVRSIIELESLAPDADADYDLFGCNYSLGERLFVDMHRILGDEATWQALGELYDRSLVEQDDLKGTSLGIEHLRAVFQSHAGALVSIGRWYDRTEDYDLSQLDMRPVEPTLPAINGKIDEAFLTVGEDGPKVSSFSAKDAAGQTLWLNLDYSYRVTGGPHELVLRTVQFYEDGSEFGWDSVEITAESQYVGGVSFVSVGSDKWAPGRYWVYIYDGDRKVAEVQYEVMP